MAAKPYGYLGGVTARRGKDWVKELPDHAIVGNPGKSPQKRSPGHFHRRQAESGCYFCSESLSTADRPARLVLAMYGATTPEVTLNLSPPLTKAVTRGTVVRFQGIAREFVKAPFMLTFEVYPDHGPTFIKVE